MVGKRPWNFAGIKYNISTIAYKIVSTHLDWYHASDAHTILNVKIKNKNSEFKIKS